MCVVPQHSILIENIMPSEDCWRGKQRANRVIRPTYHAVIFPHGRNAWKMAQSARVVNGRTRIREMKKPSSSTGSMRVIHVEYVRPEGDILPFQHRTIEPGRTPGIVPFSIPPE